jgi:hypothetical protein
MTRDTINIVNPNAIVTANDSTNGGRSMVAPIIDPYMLQRTAASPYVKGFTMMTAFNQNEFFAETPHPTTATWGSADVHDGMEALSRIHAPRNDTAESVRLNATRVSISGVVATYST